MPRKKKSKKRSNKKTNLFLVKQPELQETEKQSNHETSNIVYSERTVLDMSCDTICPNPLDGAQTYFPRSSLAQADTQDGICLNKSSSKIHYKFPSQSLETDVQQINVKTTTQADDKTLLNVIESADHVQAIQLLNGNTHFSQDGLDRALISACCHGLKYLVQELVCLEANVQFKDTLGNTPLLICAQSGFIDIVQFLLKKKADVNAINSAGDTALILSIRPAGSLEMVKVLLDQNGIDISHENQDGYTALMKAIEARDVDVMKILMDRYKKEERDGTPFRQIYKGWYLEPIEVVNSKGLSAEGIAKKCGLWNIYSILKTHINRRMSLLDTAIKRNDTESLNILLNCRFVGKQDIRESFMNIFENVNLEEVKTFTKKEIQIIKRLLKYGAEVESSWYGLSNPLSVAVKMGDYHLVELLCQHLDQQHQLGSKAVSLALIAASTSGCYDLINILLKYKADINHYKYSGSPLDCALSHGHLKCAKLLVQHGANMDIGCSLQSAVHQQLPEYMNFVCENYQPELISYAAKGRGNLNRLLLSASKGGNLEIIGRLLDAGADVNHEKYGKTPLVGSKDGNVASFLINRGAAKVNRSINDTETILLKILNDKNTSGPLVIEVVKVLLENGACVNEIGIKGRTPLMAAASEEESVAMLQLLLDHGADINSQNQKGNTALMEAIYASCPLNVSFLLEFYQEKSLSLNVQNNEGKTALTFGVIYDKPKIAKQLIDFGADVNIKDEKGNTPLLHALTRRYGPGEILTTLIEAGSDVNCQNNDGFTPLMLAAKHRMKDVITTLLDSGADVNAVSKKDSTKTALSFLSDFRDHNFKCCLETFLTKGASSSYMESDLLHLMIMAGKIDVIPELIQQGLGPADVDSKNMGLGNTINKKIPTVFPLAGVYDKIILKNIYTVSPLCVSLLVGNVSLARYFVENLFLTSSDVTSLTGNKNLHQVLKNRQHQDCLNFLEELSTKPLSLFQLAFVTVLSAVGSSPGRENRVNMLPIPQVIKDKLLFKTQEMQLNVSTKDNNFFRQGQGFTIFDFDDHNFYTGSENFIGSDDYADYDYYGSDTD